MFNEKFNSKGKKFNHDGAGNDFCKLADFANQYGIDTVYTVLGMYTHNKSQYGEKGIIITEKANIDVPQHIIKDIKTVMGDDDMVAAVNAGKCGLKIYTYTDQKGEERYSATFVDI